MLPAGRGPDTSSAIASSPKQWPAERRAKRKSDDPVAAAPSGASELACRRRRAAAQRGVLTRRLRPSQPSLHRRRLPPRETPSARWTAGIVVTFLIVASTAARG